VDETSYIKSLHYCPMCGQVIGCGDGHCNSKEFLLHIAKCRETNRVKPGRLRYNNDED